MNPDRKIYFLGIGGIGMSALARYYNHQHWKVYGYDRVSSELTRAMESEGMQIHYDDKPELIPSDLEIAVFTPAIPSDLREFQHLKNSGTRFIKRSQLLGEISASHSNIAVAGTHGKTTTSILLSYILDYCGLGITAFLGGISKNFKSNLVLKGNDWIIEEADEFDRSFLQLVPNVAIIGSLDADHLDIYGSLEVMKENYFEFSGRVKDAGILMLHAGINEEDIIRFKNLARDRYRVITYGLQEQAETRGVIHETSNGWIRFDYQDQSGNVLKDLKMRMPGNHNVVNALAAIRCCLEILGYSSETESNIRKALLNFSGIDRRFDWKLDTANKVVIEDYAHHPEELKAVIQAARNCYPDKKITGIFQPHLYSRTRDFARDFAAVLDTLDETILVELYPAREVPIPGIDSFSILNLMTNQSRHFVYKADVSKFIGSLRTEVVLILGAGDLDLFTGDIIKNLN